jgi:transposase
VSGNGKSRWDQPSQRPTDLGGAWSAAASGEDLQAIERSEFSAKVQDIVGLYVDPPEHALVLSVDEKSQIQALDRTQPGLPMKRGRCGTMTNDYKRHGTTTLFAALNVLEGKVIGQCMSRHRHQEFIRFLNKVNRETPPEPDLHLIINNYATHKHSKVRAWLERHPRFHFHFTPTSASWLNAVEGFFAKLTKQRLKRGVFKASSISKPPSTDTSSKPTITPNPSSEPPTRTQSSKKSSAGKWCWQRSAERLNECPAPEACGVYDADTLPCTSRAASTVRCSGKKDAKHVSRYRAVVEHTESDPP